jgi:hypothetical protein
MEIIQAMVNRYAVSPRQCGDPRVHSQIFRNFPRARRLWSQSNLDKISQTELCPPEQHPLFFLSFSTHVCTPCTAMIIETEFDAFGACTDSAMKQQRSSSFSRTILHARGLQIRYDILVYTCPQRVDSERSFRLAGKWPRRLGVV